MKKNFNLKGNNKNRIDKHKEVYENFTLKDIEKDVGTLLKKHHYEFDRFQSNHEGELVDCLHRADGNFSGIIFNPAAYTHTSIALHDAIMSIETPEIGRASCRERV